MSVHFSNDSNEWRTPVPLFMKLDKEFGFGMDAAADKDNTFCADYLTKEDDALREPWDGFGNVWCNPPYNLLGAFLSKAKEESTKENSGAIVMLVPSRTDTKAWHNHVMNGASEVRFIRGRLKFQGAPSSAPFPSAVVIYTPNPANNYRTPVFTTMERE